MDGFSEDDPFYLSLAENGNDQTAQLFLQATDYIAYSYDYMQPVFCFNGDAELIDVVNFGALVY